MYLTQSYYRSCAGYRSRKSYVTLVVTRSLPTLLPHHSVRPLLTICAAGWKVISSSSPAASVLWSITMQLLIMRVPPALLLLVSVFLRWTRSSWNFRSSPPSSALSLGRPSRPLQAPAPTTAAWVGTVASTSIARRATPDGFSPVTVGTGSRRSCRLLFI